MTLIIEYPFFCTPEECVDIDIKLGRYSNEERQNKIDELYKSASEILSNVLSTNRNTVR